MCWLRFSNPSHSRIPIKHVIPNISPTNSLLSRTSVVDYSNPENASFGIWKDHDTKWEVHGRHKPSLSLSSSSSTENEIMIWSEVTQKHMRERALGSLSSDLEITIPPETSRSRIPRGLGRKVRMVTSSNAARPRPIPRPWQNLIVQPNKAHDGTSSQWSFFDYEHLCECSPLV